MYKLAIGTSFNKSNKILNNKLLFMNFTHIYFREFSVMFLQADKNKNGRIDFDEFVDMMLPGQLVVKLKKIM